MPSAKSDVIKKLRNNDDPLSITKCIRSHLGNRNYFTVVRNAASITIQIRKGVPQGSTLGSNLFNIYINDIPFEYRPNTNLQTYAVDTCISAQSFKPKVARNKLQEITQVLELWLNKWRIQVNVSKCEAVVYYRRKYISNFKLLIIYILKLSLPLCNNIVH
jgi:hypothetical protein